MHGLIVARILTVAHMNFGNIFNFLKSEPWALSIRAYLFPGSRLGL